MDSGKHEYRVVNSRVEFPNTDHALYDALEQSLGAGGFSLLGDYEDVTLSRQYPLMRTFLRVMVSSDGTTTAATYALRTIGPLALLPGLLPPWTPGLDLGTEFTDGTFVETGESVWKLWARQFPAILRSRQKRLPPVAELLRRHVERRTGSLQSRHGVQARTVRTLAEALAQQERQQEWKSLQRRRSD